MKKEHKVKIQAVLFWIFLISSFLVFAWVLILEASGYRMNWSTLKLTPTSLIMLDGQPKSVQIKINGQVNKGGFPFRLAKILPGQYEINVSQDGYADWNKTFRVEPGRGVSFDKINLFLLEPKTTDVTDEYTVDNLKKDFQNQSSQLTIKNNNEIWIDDELITRFSQSIMGAILIGSRTHIIFQTGAELKVMEIDGTNITNLVKLPNEDPVSFALYGNKLVHQEQDKILETQLYN